MKLKIKNKKRSPINSLRKKKIDHKTDERKTYLDEDTRQRRKRKIVDRILLVDPSFQSFFTPRQRRQKLDRSGFNPQQVY